MSCRPPGLKIGKSVVFMGFFGTSSGFFVFFGTSSGFGNKIVPKAEQVPKKKQNFFAKT